MKDKIVIITGANRGIGKEVAKEIAKLGAKVYMACRSIDSANQVKEEIIHESKNENVFVKELNLSSVDSIHRFVESFKKEESKLKVLINNAGVMSQSKYLMNNGVEMTFAINVLGHHLLTRLLVELLNNVSPLPELLMLLQTMQEDLIWKISTLIKEITILLLLTNNQNKQTEC